MSEPLRTVNVGLIGLGTVGGGVARLIKSHHDEYLAAYGIDLKLTRACEVVLKRAHDGDAAAAAGLALNLHAARARLLGKRLGAEDIAQARELGYTIKLLGIARNTAAGVDVRVHPTLIPATGCSWWYR